MHNPNYGQSNLIAGQACLETKSSCELWQLSVWRQSINTLLKQTEIKSRSQALGIGVAGMLKFLLADTRTCENNLGGMSPLGREWRGWLGMRGRSCYWRGNLGQECDALLYKFVRDASLQMVRAFTSTRQLVHDLYILDFDYYLNNTLLFS